MASSTKVAIVGAGSVGANLAYACLIRGVAATVALYDLNAAKTSAEVLDLNHGLPFVPPARMIGSDDIDVCRDANVVVITAGAKQKPGQSRLDLAGANVAICRDLVPDVLAVAPDATLLLVSNPVDVLTYASLRFSGLPTGRVLGSGTLLDTSRLRLHIAQHCDVAVHNVHAYIAGEHGDSELPLWTSATIGAVPLLKWDVPGRSALDATARADIFQRTVTAAETIIRGKGATNYAIGLAGARIVEAILNDEQAVLSVSSLLDEVYPDLAGVCLSMPSLVGRDGVAAVLDVPLSDDEARALSRSAATVREVVAAVGL
ncbi:MAG TPA: L-lactate dehydrogenase [Euzebyales bacterium]